MIIQIQDTRALRSGRRNPYLDRVKFPRSVSLSLALLGAALGLPLSSLLAQTTLPPNLYADTAHAPFLHGVASGDPSTHSVILWTRVSSSEPVVAVVWEISESEDFSEPLQSGSVNALEESDHCVQVLVEDLDPGQRYYYRFSDPVGNFSAPGATRTFPEESKALRLAVMSCSSVYSGFFNAYGRIAERSDLQAVIHLGDYLYDFVDPDEQVRVPDPFPQVPENLQEWRERHAYYLLDPDLRAMRAAHPLIALWDNHDLDRSSVAALDQSVQAFREWVPLAEPQSGNPRQLYRRHTMGNLIDLYMLDIQMYRDQDLLAGGELSFLGNEQFEWFEGELQYSTARWQIIGNQKMVTNWSLLGLPDGLGLGSGVVLDSGSWDGYSQSRARMLSAIEEHQPGSVLLLSGDMHITVVSDLPLDPQDSLSYDPLSGEGSVAAEFLASSISRGNADEMGLNSFLIGEMIRISKDLNPHLLHLELTKHGFGIVSVYPDSLLAEIWYAPILEPSAELEFGGGWVLRHGSGHWERGSRNQPVYSEPLSLNAGAPFEVSEPFPNPAKERIYVDLLSAQDLRVSIAILAPADGRIQRNWTENLQAGQSRRLEIDTRGLSAGHWMLLIGADGHNTRKFFSIR